MNIFVWGSVLIGLAFVVHLVIWKIHLPKRQTKVLLQIFFGILIFTLILIYFGVIQFPLLGQHPPKSFSEYCHVTLYFTSFTLAYMITYSALEAESPTLAMILIIAKNGSMGLKQQSLYNLMTDEILVIPRIKDLLKDKMIVLNHEKYIITPKGVLFAKIFTTFRKILGAEKGG